MRALLFSAIGSMLAALVTPAFAASEHVTVYNSSIYTAAVKVHSGANDIGSVIVHTQRRATINSIGNAVGAKLSIILTSPTGKMVCNLETTLASAVTNWDVTGEPLVAGKVSPAKCYLRRV